MRIAAAGASWSLRWAFVPVLTVLLAGTVSRVGPTSPDAGTGGGSDGGGTTDAGGGSGGGGGSDGGGGTGGGGGSDSGIPQQPCGPMDVAFVLDVTGSMGGAIGSVKAAIPELLDQIVAASAGDYRAELVVFRDDVQVLVPFAPGNRTDIQNEVNLQFAIGGNNEPEASDEALRTVIDALGPRPHQTGTALPFRSSAVKVIVLVTDAHPGGFDDTYTVGVDDVNANQRALDAADAGIKISAVYIPDGPNGPIPDIVVIMQNYATKTGGIYLQTQPDGTGTSDAIREIIAECGGGPPPDGGTPDGGGGGGNGDVHFRTFAGQAYDFQRPGCLRLAESRSPGSNMAVQIDTRPWVNNHDTSVTNRLALSIPDGRARPYAVILGIGDPHLTIEGNGDTLVEMLGNLDGIGWVGFREPGTRQLLAEVEVARKSFSGTIGYEYLVSYHGGISDGSQVHAIAFPTYMNVTMIPVPGFAVEGMAGNSPPRPALGFGDGSGLTATVQQLRSDVTTLNVFAQSWSTDVAETLFPTGCPGIVGTQDAIIAPTAAQQAAVADICRANGIPPDAGPAWEGCVFDAVVGGAPAAFNAGVTYARQQLGLPIGTPAPIEQSFGPDAGTPLRPPWMGYIEPPGAWTGVPSHLMRTDDRP
jgi:hypothetical protein